MYTNQFQIMAGLEDAEQARHLLQQRLKGLRKQAGLTQEQLAGRIGNYSRSTVARAESLGDCSRDFCVKAGRALGVGTEITRLYDRAAALSSAVRSEIGQDRRAGRAGPVAAGPDDSADVATSTHSMECPHCGGPIVVLIRQEMSVLPLGAGPDGDAGMLANPVTTC